MRVWATLYNFFAVLLLMFIFMVMYKDIIENERQFEELRLKYAVDYATEAAFVASLEGGNLGISYQDLQNVRVVPENTLGVFKTAILMSYDMSLSEENYSSLDNYIASGVLAVADGYYIATPKQYEDNKLSWGLKKPYRIDYGTDTAVAYNLSNENWALVRQAGSTLTIQRGIRWNDLPEYVTKPTADEITTKLNKLIMDDINYNIRERNREKMKVSSTVTTDGIRSKDVNDFVYLPSVQTESGVNTITKPSIFFSLAGVDFAGTHRIEAQSVGGFTVVKKRRIIVFNEGGTNYYCYEGQLDDISRITNFYNSTDEAAKNGYIPHLVNLSKPLK